jgi:hypothetical protein
MNRKLSWAIVILCLMTTKAISQNISQDVIATSGSSGRTPTLNIDWTIGEQAVETYNGTTQIYTQGFQQPLLRITPQPTSDISFPGAEIIVAPNPFVQSITARIRLEEKQDVSIHILDAQGKKLLSSPATSDFVPVSINMQQFATGTYYLNFLDPKGTLIKSFKILKTN